MAESMLGLKRSHRCTELSLENAGQEVTVMGWVQKRRNLGAMIFVDLRDISGLLQILFDETYIGKEGFDKAYTLRNEYVIAVEGTIEKRKGAVNESLATGELELCATSLRILAEAQTPPSMRLKCISATMSSSFGSSKQRSSIGHFSRY